MKLNALLFVLSFLCFSLSAQVDKTAITKAYTEGWHSDQYHQTVKKHLSPNLKYIWPDGNVWPDGSEGSLEAFWTFYTSHSKNYRSRQTSLEIRELGNETYAFGGWEATVLKDEEHPECVGTTAKGPAATRMIWEGDKIKEIYLYADLQSRTQQHEAQAKKQ
ncbi:MAG: hypothetical protein AAF849_22520 [Bacteroidota bacterium]